MKSSRPIHARINKAALLHNHNLARQMARNSKIWSVVKANAYGHGLWRVIEALRDETDGFAVLEPETGAAMRETRVRQPILLLEGVFSAQDVRLLIDYRLTTVVHCREQLELIEKTAPPGAPLALYIKLNTGMNRLGFTADNFPTPQEMAARLPLAEVTYMTHFADADDERGVDWQLQRFQAQTKDWQGPVCLANSAAILRHPQTHGDWVRPGIMLYGSSPFAEASAFDLGLQPVMTLASSIISVQKVAAGERVGYGGTFTADRPMRIGTVACGYADGYPRHAPTGGPIAVCGHRTRIIGRVSMDLLACDLTDIPMAGIGAPVTLWGQGEGGDLPTDEVAAAAGTISYELYCALAARVPVETVG